MRIDRVQYQGYEAPSWGSTLRSCFGRRRAQLRHIRERVLEAIETAGEPGLHKKKLQKNRIHPFTFSFSL